MYIVFYVLCAIALFLRRLYFDFLVENGCTESGSTEHTTTEHSSESGFNNLKSDCMCAYLHPSDDSRYVRWSYFSLTWSLFMNIKKNYFFTKQGKSFLRDHHLLLHNRTYNRANQRHNRDEHDCLLARDLLKPLQNTIHRVPHFCDHLPAATSCVQHVRWGCAVRAHNRVPRHLLALLWKVFFNWSICSFVKNFF
jgi:hypothetical protein